MATLSRRSFDEYCALLDEIERRAVDGFRERAYRASVLFMNAADEASRGLYRQGIAYEVYGRIERGQAQAQVRADDMFEAMTGETPAPHAQFLYEAAERRVRSCAKHLFDEGSVDEFLRVLESFIVEEVRSAANNAIAENVEKANT